jgi:hypothetical protein
MHILGEDHHRIDIASQQGIAKLIGIELLGDGANILAVMEIEVNLAPGGAVGAPEGADRSRLGEESWGCSFELPTAWLLGCLIGTPNSSRILLRCPWLLADDGDYK